VKLPGAFDSLQAMGRRCKMAGSATISPVSGLRSLPKSAAVISTMGGGVAVAGREVLVGTGAMVGGGGRVAGLAAVVGGMTAVVGEAAATADVGGVGAGVGVASPPQADNKYPINITEITIFKLLMITSHKTSAVFLPPPCPLSNTQPTACPPFPIPGPVQSSYGDFGPVWGIV